jgi:hypothetical protein
VGATGVTPTMGVVVAVPDRRQLDLPPRSLVLEVYLLSTGFPLSVGAADPSLVARCRPTPDRPSSDQALTESAFLRDMEPADTGAAQTQAMPP